MQSVPAPLSVLDCQICVVGERGEESDGAALLLVGYHLGEGDARGIVDADVDVFPAHASAVALSSAVAGDAMTDVVEPA